MDGYPGFVGLISENHAWVILIILGLKVEINLHLFAYYPQFLRLPSGSIMLPSKSGGADNALIIFDFVEKFA